MSKISLLYCAGKIVPKKRPLVNTTTKQGTLPDNYRKWKEAAKISLGKQWEHLHGNKQLVRAHITVIFGGAQHGDPDNLVGSVLDAMVQTDIISDDKIFNIPFLCVIHKPELVLGCEIKIKALQWSKHEVNRVKISEDLTNVF